MADKYFRVVTAIVNVCPKPFRKLLTDLARIETTNKGQPFIDLDCYLKQHTTKVLTNPRFTRDHLNQLYPPAPGKVDVNDLDLTLLAALLETLFHKVLGPTVSTCLKKLKSIRNDLQHRASTLSITDTEFQQIWNDITTETTKAANVIDGPKFEKEIKIDIMKAQTSYIATLGVVLLKWYNSVILETKTNTDQIREDTQHIRALLEGAAVKRKRRSGSDVNHFRSANDIQETLIRNFKITEAAFKEKAIPVPERVLSKISKCLSERKSVILSGHGNSKYIHVAVVAIQRLNVEDACCAELNNPEELFSVNGEEVRVLFLRNSFLSNLLGKDKNYVLYTLDRLQYHISNSENPLMVVMVCDKHLLERFGNQFQHQILTTAINVDTPTSQDDPEDLTRSVRDEPSDTVRSMLAWSSLFLHEREMISHDDPILKKAEEVYRKHNFAVCVGERADARSAVAVYLAKLNGSDACLVISDPDELKYIELGKVDVLLILDFAGRFRYDEAKVHKWLEKFDLLYDAVKNGIISVIITSHESRLRMCQDETASHILLRTIIPIPDSIVLLKKKDCSLDRVVLGNNDRMLHDEPHAQQSEFHIAGSVNGVMTANGAMSSGDTGLGIISPVDVNVGIQMGRDSLSAETNVPSPVASTPDQDTSSILHMNQIAKMSVHTFGPADVDIKHHNITKNDIGDDYDSCVWGMCQLPDRSFILLDYYKQRIKQYNANFKFMKQSAVIGSAKCICCTGQHQITIAFEKALTVFNVKFEIFTSHQIEISPDLLTSNLKKLFVMDKTSRIIHVYNVSTFSFVEAIHVPVVETYSPAFCKSLTISQSGEKFYIEYLDMIKCFNKYGVALATYEIPEHNEARRYRKFRHTAMCQAGEDVLLFIAQGNKEEIAERFVFLNASLSEIQKGDIRLLSDNHKTPSVMCYDSYRGRAILGYKKGPFVTDVQFLAH